MGKYLDLVLCFMTNQAPFLRTSQLLMLPLMSFSVGAGELQPLHYCHCMPLSPPGLSRRDIPLTLSHAGLFSAPEPHMRGRVNKVDFLDFCPSTQIYQQSYAFKSLNELTCYFLSME